MNGKRKNRSSLGRSPRGRGIERIPSIDGIYHNANFMHAITSQIGNIVKVYTHTGTVFEGILKTFSSHFEVVLEIAHKIDSNCPAAVTVNTVIEKIIFKPQDIIFVEVLDSESDYATRDTFQTDTAISKFNGQFSERELEPWDGSGSHGDECELDAKGSLNGWDVDDMFRKNEQMYGVTSTFDYAMPGYTTQLQNKDSKDYKDAEAKAAKIANEIENNPSYKARADAENGDEEEKYAAVVRPSPDSVSSESTNKYVCPPKRKTQPAPVKPARNSHVKIPDHKPSTNLSYYHPPVPTPTNNGSHTNVRERINGVSEPKPQRSIPNHRLVGRNYTNAAITNTDNSRTSSNGFVVGTPAPVVEIKQPPNQISITSPSNSTSNVISSTSEVSVPPVQRKLPQNPPQIHSTTSEHISSPRPKPARGREEYLTELKKFSADFHLPESTEEPSKPQVINTPSEEESRLVPEAPVPVSTEAPVTTRPLMNISPIAADPEKPAAPPYSNSKLNPNAKEFIYNPNAKPFTPRASSTPTQSRPHTPQTPSYGVPSVPSIPAMVVPTYVVTTAQPHYTPPPNQSSRYRKVHMGMPQRPDLSQMQVAAATGQPLLAPGPIPAQFTVPYSSQTHLANQPYSQMVRMVAQQGGGMVPLVPATLNYPPDASQAQHLPYMGQGAMTAGPHHPHHNPHIHGNAVSPQPATNGQLGMNGNGGANTGANGANSATNNGHQPYSSIHHNPQSQATSYTQAPPPPQANPNPPAFPLMCPMIPAPPPPPPPPPHPGPHNAHHLISGVPSSVHLHHHHHQHQHQSPNPVGSQQTHHIQSRSTAKVITGQYASHFTYLTV